MPRGAAVGGVIETLVTHIRAIRVHQRAFIGLRNRRHHQLRIDRAPGKAGESLADEAYVLGAQAVLLVARLLDQAPGVAAVGGAQNAGAVVGIEHVVGVAGAGQDDACPARLHGERANADGGVGRSAESRHVVSERGKDDGGRRWHARVVRQPHAAAGGSHVEAIAGRVGRIERQRGDAAGDEAEVRGFDSGGAEGLPGCARCRLAAAEPVLAGAWEPGRRRARTKRPLAEYGRRPGRIRAEEKVLRFNDARRQALRWPRCVTAEVELVPEA